MNKQILIIGITIILLLIISVSGCINTDTSDNNDFLEEIPPENNIEIITISGMGSIETINYLEKPVKLVVTGMNCDIIVTKETILKEVIIAGMNSIVRVSRSHSFSSTISGMKAQIIYYD